MRDDKELWICTGKAGDLLNILPICKHRHDAGKPVALMVAREFISILDGVSYAEPVMFDGFWMNVGEAYDQAKKLFKTTRVLQVAGNRPDIMNIAYKSIGLNVGDPQTESFIKEQWRIAGCLPQFKDNLPLVFDRRDPKREAELVDLHLSRYRETARICLIYMGGKSSPYKLAKLVGEYMPLRFHGRRWGFVDLSEVHAERLYDLLGLYDEAKMLISTDSAPLHLAPNCRPGSIG